jgi:stearoyl-CoA desaturase (Delta-9 desaturase)
MEKSNIGERDWTVTLFILGYHILFLIGVPIYLMNYSVSWQMWATSFALLYGAGMCVTAGYHRLYSHSTYKTNRWVEVFLLFFASVATQGSALKWSYDHRRHHAFVDTDEDPYSIKKGFWFAHILWLFRKTKPIEKRVVADLYRNPLVMFQHKYFGACMVVSNLIVTLAIGYALNDYFGAFMISWLTRLFFLHHFTWFINSLAHTWGTRPFSQEHSAMDCYTVCLVTFGEGYHNYHHTFAGDYRNGIKWYHFDPTKWMIWTLYKLGLASNLKRTSPVQIREKMILEGKEAISNKLKDFWVENKASLEASVEKVSSEFLAKVSRFQELSTQYKAYKKQKLENAALNSDPDMINKMKQEIKSLHKDIKEDWKRWQKLCNNILSLKPSLSQK